MDVNSVNKPAVQPAPAPRRATEARPASTQENNKPQENEAQKAAQAQQNKPVLNTQGQITGRNLNVTA
jgi:hypothetical protein